MGRFHLVRVGATAQVGRFRAVDATSYPRGTGVIVRTERGLEVGEVLAPPASDAAWGVADGELLRGMTVEDHLLESRLSKHRQEAYEACANRLAELNLPVVLMDVEHLFDGQSLYFYFLGPQLPELDQLTDELAETYEARVQFRKFSETLTAGCGPGCGTEAAEGTGCGSGCGTSCAVAGACGTRRS